MQIVDGRLPDARMFTVDLADELFEVLAFTLVMGVVLAARNRDLDHDVSRRPERAFGNALTTRSQPPVDTFRVVEAIDSQHDELRIAELEAYVARPRLHRRIARPLHQLRGIDRDRKRTDSHVAAIEVHQRVGSGRAGYPPRE